MPYQALDAERLAETIRTLGRRIEERFPGSSLSLVAQELVGLSHKASRTTDEAARPILALRLSAFLLTALVVAGLATTVAGLRTPEAINLIQFVQVLESGINDVVLLALGAFFLLSAERRVKRRRILRAIHELRSIAHIVDMHQLTKDPGHFVRRIVDTPSSPVRSLSQVDLMRYLDYCSELLSLTGKIAALYVERFDDAVVLASVNEVEALTTGLSGKIWQKLMILETLSVSDV